MAKVFTPDIDLAKVSRQIEWAERLGVLRFAPTVHDWNIEERWYEEEYINGYQAAASNWTKLVSLLADAILAFPPQEVRALDHVLERRELIRRSKLFNERHDGSKLAAMQRFVDTTIDHLRRSGDMPIFLVCSHGDFSPSHVLTTKHKDVVIDWEAAANRSALFDLHNSFFRRLRGGATATGMAEAIEQAISQLKGFLVQRGRGAHDVLTESLATAEIYRRVYYVEYIYSYVEKENVKARHLDRILFFMDAFNYHEERLLAATQTMER